MRRSIVAALAAGFTTFAAAGLPDMLFDNGSVSIRLKSTPCLLAGPLGALTNAVSGAAFSATVVYQGKTIKACWAFAPERQIVIVDDEGDGGVVAMDAFKPVE